MTQQSLVKKAASRPPALMPVMEQERRIMAVAEEYRWPFRVLGVAPVPEQPVYHSQWWLVPVQDDRSQIPARTLERVQAIYAAGIRPKAFIVAHEAPAQLVPPSGTPMLSRLEYLLRETGKHSKTALVVAGKVAVTTAVLAAGVVGVGVVGAVALAALGLSVVLIDPCLIVVTEDDVWIQVDYWMA